MIEQTLISYLESVNWPVAFTCVIVNYLIGKSLTDVSWAFRWVGWISRFWQTMIVSIAVGIVFVEVFHAGLYGVVQGVIWSHLIYKAFIQWLIGRFGL
jgi:hypothetical protein